jgi:flagellar M-ring protein FliF
MHQIRKILASLSLRQKISLAAAVVAVAAGLVAGVRWNRERDLRPLFTNVAAEDAGAIIAKLKSSNVEYKVIDGGAILVPSARVAELRLEMAGAGLPRTGRLGFELFDKTNLGATDFAEHVNYRRALEGELERSVMSLAEVERARVHVTFAKESLYLDARQPAKASVMVRLHPGRSLSPQNVLAVQHLTASAVEGLAPEAVSILDMNGNLLSRPRQRLDEEAGASSAMLDYRQTLEREYLAKIRATLDPLLGPDKYRAGVSAECDFTSGEQSEETFDPNKSVMLTSQRTEDISGGGVSAGGVPGAASNLPRPAPRATAGAGGVSRKTENTTFQTSRVVKRLKLPQGTLRRLSVSVLVDQKLRWEGTGARARRVLEPPPAETLKVVRDVLAGVVGFSQDRGDQILVESLPFEATLMAVPPEAPESGAKPAPGWTPPAWMQPLLKQAPVPVWLGAAAALLIVLLVSLGLFVRMLLRRKRGQNAAGLEAGPNAVTAGGGAAQLKAGEESGFEDKAMAVLAQNKAEQERLERETILSLQLPPQTKKSEVLKKVIAEQAKKDAAATAQLIRTWITEGRQ